MVLESSVRYPEPRAYGFKAFWRLFTSSGLPGYWDASTPGAFKCLSKARLRPGASIASVRHVH